ncbi:MAG TPA: molybdopterin biosynthesis protein [Spirochaetota bacterium]|nr:molybdopterin biosynthesis protein [Spirochaetota bacterium]
MAFTYLDNKDLDYVVDEYLTAVSGQADIGDEEIEVTGCLGRITSMAVYAVVSSPHYLASAMDGIATNASKTFGATETNPVILKENEDFEKIDTGDPIPDRFDTVVMIEDVIELDNDKIQLISAAFPWQNIRQIGEDLCQGEMIIPSNIKIEPAIVGALLAGGVSRIRVWRKPRVGIIPTGDEIIKPTDNPEKGKIIEFNSSVFSAMLHNWGAEFRIYDIVPDKYDLIHATASKALSECDIVLINAGSSAGRDDYTTDIIKDLGEVLFHGIAIKPGKPAILGIAKNKPVIGIPGYPVSGIIIMEQIVKKVLELYSSNSIQPRPVIKAVLSRKFVSSLKYREFIRVKLGDVDGKIIATPLTSGAGVITSFVKADGLLTIPQNTEGYENGSIVDIELLKSITSIKNTIVVTGSHDPLIDEISDILRQSDFSYFVASSHVGSMGGIMAIKRNEAHIAGIHLLDEATGEYNVPYIKKYLNTDEVALVKGVKRTQGLIVQKNNPMNITKISDLDKINIRFVNRQKGSGTRILLDYLLNKENINPDNIYGYTREEYTHLSVAVQIANGSADAGLGIYSAAGIYDLDFVPVCEEEYDFIIQRKNLESDHVRKFLSVLKSEEFKHRLLKIGGYSLEHCGEIIS